MPSNTEMNYSTGLLFEEDAELNDGSMKHDTASLREDTSQDRFEYVWLNCLLFPVAHAIAIYGGYLALTSASICTSLFTVATYWFTMVGLLAGTHRLWSHRSFKANTGLQVFLMLGATMAYQNSIIHWVREHRAHHKFSHTNADPVNPDRGLFFSHVGWLMIRKHPDVKAKGKSIDMSDMEQNPVLAFNKKHYVALTTLVAGVLPLIVPMWLWNETLLNSFCIAVVLRWVCTLNAIFVINSFAHTYGDQPFDKNTQARQSYWVTVVTGGDGWHNYHHTFPWDYRASEHGFVNFVSHFIEFCAYMGWAWNLKTVTPNVVKRRVQRTGDGTHPYYAWNKADPEQQGLATFRYRRVAE